MTEELVHLHTEADRHVQTIHGLKQHLAASQAREKVLRELLENYSRNDESGRCVCCGSLGDHWKSCEIRIALEDE